jgi:hypothetical protein
MRPRCGCSTAALALPSVFPRVDLQPPLREGSCSEQDRSGNNAFQSQFIKPTKIQHHERSNAMSDSSAVIAAFVGERYVSDGDVSGIPEKHRQWFPGAGVLMTIKKIEMEHDSSKSYAKVTISESPAKGVIEKTAYRAFATDVLVGHDLELAEGVVLSREMLIVMRDKDGKRTGVRHELEFADGTTGFWLCPDRP